MNRYQKGKLFIFIVGQGFLKNLVALFASEAAKRPWTMIYNAYYAPFFIVIIFVLSVLCILLFILLLLHIFSSTVYTCTPFFHLLYINMHYIPTITYVMFYFKNKVSE